MKWMTDALGQLANRKITSIKKHEKACQRLLLSVPKNIIRRLNCRI
jgi:hypothetical protein